MWRRLFPSAVPVNFGVLGISAGFLSFVVLTVVLAVVLELEIVAGVPLIPVEPAPYPAADAPLLPVPSPP